MRMGLRHDRRFERRPFFVRKRQRLPLFFETKTVTFATLPRNALFDVPVLHTRSIVRPLIRKRRRVARRWCLLMLERGSTRSPHTELIDESGVAGATFGLPLH